MKARLRFSAAAAGGLLVSAVGVRRTISILMRAESAQLLYPSERPVELSWDAFGRPGSDLDRPLQDGWRIAAFAAGRAGPMGVGVRVIGHFDVASHDLRRATMGWWRRFNQWGMLGMVSGHLLPVLPTYMNVSGGHKRERDSLTALATVLARRDDLRAALQDNARVVNLANDLSRRLLPFPVERTGARRDTIDIIYALHRAGFAHRFARPIGNEPLPALADVVAKTRARLDANPYRVGRVVDDAMIERVARRNYLDIEPWPFGALL